MSERSPSRNPTGFRRFSPPGETRKPRFARVFRGLGSRGVLVFFALSRSPIRIAFCVVSQQWVRRKRRAESIATLEWSGRSVPAQHPPVPADVEVNAVKHGMNMGISRLKRWAKIRKTRANMNPPAFWANETRSECIGAEPRSVPSSERVSSISVYLEMELRSGLIIIGRSRLFCSDLLTCSLPMCHSSSSNGAEFSRREWAATLKARNGMASRNRAKRSPQVG